MHIMTESSDRKKPWSEKRMVKVEAMFKAMVNTDSQENGHPCEHQDHNFKIKESV